MKKIILLAIIVTSLFSCSNERTADDRYENVASPQKSTYDNKEIVVIGKYNVSSGWLYVYRIGGDTIYVMEGKSESFPVSINVK